MKMRFRVRTPDGELSFQTIYEVEKAWQAGLIDPDDEIIDDQGLTRHAKDHPQLTPRKKPSRLSATNLRVSGVAVIGLALLFIWYGTGWPLWVRGTWVALGACVVLGLLGGVTRSSFSRPRRR